MAAFAAFGLLLAALGIYSVIAFAVLQRTPEIGLRIALGAPRSAVMAFVLRGGVRLGLIGLGLGSVAAIVLNRLLVSLLPQIAPLEPAVVGLAMAVLLTCIVVACYLPARRAARLDPLVALRSR